MAAVTVATRGHGAVSDATRHALPHEMDHNVPTSSKRARKQDSAKRSPIEGDDMSQDTPGLLPQSLSSYHLHL